MYGGMPYKKDVTDVRCPSHFARAEYDLWESLGRFSLAGGGSLFPRGACRLLPSAVKPCNPFPCTPAARARPSALTLNPLRLSRDFGALYSVAPLLVRHFQRFALRHVPTLSLSPEFVLPVVALAPPRKPPHTCRASIMTCGGLGYVRECLRSRVIKKKPVRLVESPCGHDFLIISSDLFADYLRRDSSLTSYILSVVVDIDAESCVGA